MVGESLTTRLARERLSAIRKILPLRDKIREKLQQRQLLQTDFTEDTEQLFKPIVSATEGVKTATERAIYGDVPKEGERVERPLLGELEKIAKRTKQTKKSLKTLPGDIITTARRQEQQEQQERELQEEVERLGDVDISSPPPELEEFQEQEEETGAVPRGDYSPENIFTVDALNKIRNIPTLAGLAKFTNDNVKKKKRNEYLKDNTAKDFVDGSKTWANKVFLANRKEIRITKEISSDYNQFLAMVKGVTSAPPVYTADPIPDEIQIMAEADSQSKTPEFSTLKGATGTTKKKGSGLVGKNPMDFHASVTCPGNILGDIARLEVLVGGKRAGNNSPEIINEAADICRRLFQGGIMDIATYRDFIEELVDGYHSD